jgi:hypothetical protein
MSNADIGEHAIIQPFESFGRCVATLPVADRLKDVFHGHGFLALVAVLSNRVSISALQQM